MMMINLQVFNLNFKYGKDNLFEFECGVYSNKVKGAISLKRNT